MKRLQQGFAVTGGAKEAGKKGQKARVASMGEKKKKGEKQWEGGFRKGDPITVLRSKLAIQERWRRYYEQKASELEQIRSAYDEQAIAEDFEEAKRSYEAIVDKVKRHERSVSELQQKLALVAEVERKIHFGPLPSDSSENGGMMGPEDSDVGRERVFLRNRDS